MLVNYIPLSGLLCELYGICHLGDVKIKREEVRYIECCM